MLKKKELIPKIEAIKSRLGLKTQAQLAEKIGAKQQSVSAWLKPTSRIIPAAESLNRLFNLADDQDKSWFLEQAGIDIQKMLRYAERVFLDRVKTPKKGSWLKVPHLRMAGKESIGARPPALWRVFLDEELSNADLQYWEGRGFGVLHRPGTKVLLDTSYSDSRYLKPFWGSNILAESSDPSMLGFFLGELRLEDEDIIPAGYENPTLCSARLLAWSPIASTQDHPDQFEPLQMDVPADRLQIGRWRLDDTEDKEKLRKRESEFLDGELVRQRAREEMTLLSHWKILGRVIEVRFPGTEERAVRRAR